MNTAWLQQPWLETLGWTLVHSLWELSLIAALAAIALLLLRRHSSQMRYLLSYTLLLTMMATPIGTYTYLWAHQASAASPPVTRGAAITESAIVVSAPTKVIPHEQAAQANIWQQTITCLQALPPYAAIGYLIGAAALTLRLLAGYGALRRVRTGALPATEHEPLLKELCHRLHLSLPVQLLRSTSVEVPTVIGAWRPIILLPITATTGLSTEHLTYLLLHELAHIRRHDYLANLAQSLVETLLFYHPAVAWLSAQVRQEREHCCDDLAIAAAGNRRTYAAALASMESLRAAPANVPGQLALGARGGSLLQRIRRILEVPPPRSINQRLITGSSLVVIASILALALYLIGCSHKPEIPPAQTQTANGTERMQILAEPIHGKPATQPTTEELLTMHVDLNVDQAPLQSVLESLTNQAHITLVVNWTALQQEGVEKKTLISAKLRDVPFSRALKQVLASVGGTASLDASMNNSVLTVSTQADLDQKEGVVTRTYKIQNMLDHLVIRITSQIGDGASDHQLPPSPEAAHAEVVQSIMKAITSAVAPATWRANDGTVGSMTEDHGVLTVTQTMKNQAEVESVLQQLRLGAALQISVEDRMMFVTDTLYTSLKLPPPTTENVHCRVLSDTELRSVLQQTQDDPKTIAIASPRLTLFSGQAGFIRVGQNSKKDPGIRLDLKAAASADRHSVIMNLQQSLTQLGTEEQKFSANVTVPDGGVILMDGPTMKNDNDSNKSDQCRLMILVRAKIVEEVLYDSAGR